MLLRDPKQKIIELHTGHTEYLKLSQKTTTTLDQKLHKNFFFYQQMFNFIVAQKLKKFTIK